MSATSAVTVSELVAALRPRATESMRPDEAAQGPTRPPTLGAEPRVLGVGRVVVVGAHPWAGTSTVALALADLAAVDGPVQEGPVLMVDTAGVQASGLQAAIATEVRCQIEGWHAGRRSNVTVLTPTAAISLAECMAVTGSGSGGGSGRWVVDVARPWRALLEALPHDEAELQGARVVVVSRASVPGIGRAEAALAGLPWGSLLVAVGERKWPPAVRASFGPRVAQLVAQGRVFLVPSHRGLAVGGIDTRPLPRPVLMAVSRLLPHLAADVVAPCVSTLRGEVR